MRLSAIPLLPVFLIISALHARSQTPSNIYTIEHGQASFKSEAPLELIQAESNELKGLIDFSNETFAFTIPINSFKGFNSALQREHFNENYLESEKFPRATFTGRMIEKIDFSTKGQHTIKAKGKLNIHGIENERIIRALVTIKDGSIHIESDFSVLLQDHNIAIPKVVQYKIAEEIFVKIKADATKK
jgi:polyisoprenoid-binding protein YceI